MFKEEVQIAKLRQFIDLERKTIKDHQIKLEQMEMQLWELEIEMTATQKIYDSISGYSEFHVELIERLKKQFTAQKNNLSIEAKKKFHDEESRIKILTELIIELEESVKAQMAEQGA